MGFSWGPHLVLVLGADGIFQLYSASGFISFSGSVLLFDKAKRDSAARFMLQLWKMLTWSSTVVCSFGSNLSPKEF